MAGGSTAPGRAIVTTTIVRQNKVSGRDQRNSLESPRSCPERRYRFERWSTCFFILVPIGEHVIGHVAM